MRRRWQRHTSSTLFHCVGIMSGCSRKGGEILHSVEKYQSVQGRDVKKEQNHPPLHMKYRDGIVLHSIVPALSRYRWYMQSNLRRKDTLGAGLLSFVRRLSLSRRFTHISITSLFNVKKYSF